MHEHVHGENCNHEHQTVVINSRSTEPDRQLDDLARALRVAPNSEEKRKARNKRKAARREAMEMATSKEERRAVRKGATVMQLFVGRTMRGVRVGRERTARRERERANAKRLLKIERLGKNNEPSRGTVEAKSV